MSPPSSSAPTPLARVLLSQAPYRALAHTHAHAVHARSARYRIVLYNDGSRDHTVTRTLEWRNRLNVEVIGKDVNLGLGEGLRCLVAHTAQHLHGGIGSDMEYPIHRYFLWAKQVDVTLGGANRQLARLGGQLPDI